MSGIADFLQHRGEDVGATIMLKQEPIA